ncbi:MAG: RNA 2',3'-cyclic phosphodiesterase [Pyrinomonadaceae bacterium]|nr:RNA 2',3'-cyclic phosphodiesterase [Pyrinomonadaceae bacterium]
MRSEVDEREATASRLRLFCAVELPQGVRAQAARYIAWLREAAPDVRASWDREDKLHLTLKFFGDTEEDRVAQLSDALSSAASTVNSFKLLLRGTGAFPPSGLARVLWLGVTDSSGRLDTLNRRIEDECAPLGFARERKRFHPHLTIARLRSPEGARKIASQHKSMEFESDAFTVAEIVLIKSDLGPQGSRYTKIGQYRLR